MGKGASACGTVVKNMLARYNMKMNTLLRSAIRAMLVEAPIRQHLAMDIPDDVIKISSMLSSAGFHLFVVGGAVRDALLGKVPKDIDLATDADPDTIVGILSRDLSFKIKEIGKAFGVVLVTTPAGDDFEIATFRKDLSSGRRPDAVEFTTIDQDVSRRDLTINALFYDIKTGEVVDYVGGIDDVKNGIVRAVGAASQRFQEDRLRILRVMRFVGRFGGSVDAATAAAIHADNRLTGVGPKDDISRERIRDEFMKGIASARSVVHYLATTEEFGLLQQVFEGLPVNINFFEIRDPAVQLALILRDANPSVVSNRLNFLKFTSDEAAQVKFLLSFQYLDGPAGAVTLRKSFKGAKLNPAQLKVFSECVGMPDRQRAAAFIKFLSEPPAASSAELMARGISGPSLGRALDYADADRFSQIMQEI